MSNKTNFLYIDFITGMSLGLELPNYGDNYDQFPGTEIKWGILLHLFIVRFEFIRVTITDEKAFERYLDERRY